MLRKTEQNLSFMLIWVVTLYTVIQRQYSPIYIRKRKGHND